jgi:hypothetical protein
LRQTLFVAAIDGGTHRGLREVTRPLLWLKSCCAGDDAADRDPTAHALMPQGISKFAGRDLKPQTRASIMRYEPTDYEWVAIPLRH